MQKNMKTRLLKLEWIDQITSNAKQTADFYSSLLGVGQVLCDNGKSFALTDEEGKELFGVVDEGGFPDWAHGWVAYFEVDDLEASCAKVVELGGTIISKRRDQFLFKDPSGSPTVFTKLSKASG